MLVRYIRLGGLHRVSDCCCCGCVMLVAMVTIVMNNIIITVVAISVILITYSTIVGFIVGCAAVDAFVVTGVVSVWCTCCGPYTSAYDFVEVFRCLMRCFGHSIILRSGI